MTGEISIEKTLEEMSKRLARAEQANRAIKIWSSIAFAALIAFGSGPFASTVLAKKKPPALLQAENIELVTSTGQVLASLGVTSEGNALTFFDSSGKKTLFLGNSADGTATGLETFDGNGIFPGTGVVRTAFGEANAKNASGGNLGFAVADAAGKFRFAAGTTPDVKIGFAETIDPNGSTAGIVDDGKTFLDQGFFANDLHGKNRTFVGNSLDGTTFNSIQTFDPNGSTAGIEDASGTLNQGFFANDLNGKNRIFAGNSLDGTSYDQISFSDTKGNFAGLLGTNSAFTPPAMDLFLIDPSGTFFAGENSDGAGVDWTLADTNSVIRSFGAFDGSNEAIDEFSPTGVLVGHLP